MIPVTQQPEPVDFEKNVRRPGGRFLLKTPIPTTKQWESRACWRRSIPSLYQTYKGICAYSAEWIPEGVGDPTVDHYFPKSTHPELAYGNCSTPPVEITQRAQRARSLVKLWGVHPHPNRSAFPDEVLFGSPTAESSGHRRFSLL